MNERNPEGKDIRFIDSHYKDLFRIPDGGCVQIHYPDETVIKPCTFIDEYHTRVGYNVFHICSLRRLWSVTVLPIWQSLQSWAMKPHGEWART